MSTMTRKMAKLRKNFNGRKAVTFSSSAHACTRGEGERGERERTDSWRGKARIALPAYARNLSRPRHATSRHADGPTGGSFR